MGNYFMAVGIIVQAESEKEAIEIIEKAFKERKEEKITHLYAITPQNK